MNGAESVEPITVLLETDMTDPRIQEYSDRRLPNSHLNATNKTFFRKLILIYNI